MIEISDFIVSLDDALQQLSSLRESVNSEAPQILSQLLEDIRNKLLQPHALEVQDLISTVAEPILNSEKKKETILQLKADLEELDTSCRSVKIQLQPQSEKAIQSIAELSDSVNILKETVMLLQDVPEDQVSPILLKSTIEQIKQLEEPMKLMTIAIESTIVKPQTAILSKNNKELSSAVKLLKENLVKISASSDVQVMQVVIEPIQALQAQIAQIQEQMQVEQDAELPKEEVPQVAEIVPVPEKEKKEALLELKAVLGQLDTTCKSVKVQLQPQSEKAIQSIANLSDSVNCKSVKVQLQPQSEKAIQSIANLSDSVNTLKETVTLLEDVAEDQVSPMLIKSTIEQIKQLEEPIKLMATAVESTIIKPQTAMLSKDNKELLSAVKLLKENLQKISVSSDAQVMQVVMEPIQALQAQIAQIQEQIQIEPDAELPKEEIPQVAEVVAVPEKEKKIALLELKAELGQLDNSCKSVKVQLQPQSEKAIQSIADLSDSVNTLKETVTLLEDVAEDQVSPILLKSTIEQIKQLEEPIKLMTIAVESAIVKSQTAILCKDNKELSSAVQFLKKNLEKISASSEQMQVEPDAELPKEETPQVTEAAAVPEKEKKITLLELKAELGQLDNSCKSVKVQLQPQSEKAIQSIANLSDSVNTLKETVTLLEDLAEDQVSPILLKSTIEQIKQLEEPIKLMTIAVESTIIKPQTAILSKDNKELSSAVKLLKENLEKISASSDAQVMQVVIEPIQALQAQIAQIQEQMQVEPDTELPKEEIPQVAEIVVVPEKEKNEALLELKAELGQLDTEN
ncbi:hypothetical protein QE152_g22515 [Popillia japonica]|uniref:Uncharacterized protein n=1 Tax=Popillia japonica TaxID=7064 RepID=A0AAW1KKK5_POPJA